MRDLTTGEKVGIGVAVVGVGAVLVGAFWPRAAAAATTPASKPSPGPTTLPSTPATTTTTTPAPAPPPAITGASYDGNAPLYAVLGLPITVPVGASLQVDNVEGRLWDTPGVTSSDEGVMAPSNPATSAGFVALRPGTATLTGAYTDAQGNPVAWDVPVTVKAISASPYSGESFRAAGAVQASIASDVVTKLSVPVGSSIVLSAPSSTGKWAATTTSDATIVRPGIVSNAGSPATAMNGFVALRTGVVTLTGFYTDATSGALVAGTLEVTVV